MPRPAPDDDNDEDPPPRRKPPAEKESVKPADAARRPKPRREEEFEEDDRPRRRREREDDEEEDRPRARRRRRQEEDDEDDYEDDRPRRRRRKDPIETLIPYHNPKALAAYYCGVFSLICVLGLILGPIALILGILGIKYSRQNDTAGGMGHAIAGVVLGALTTLGNWGVVLFVGYMTVTKQW